MAIEIPPWLTPSAAQGWGDLAARGAALQLERARIQQSGINANMEAQARREAQQAEAQRQQQQLQYTDAYRKAELGLRQQALEDQQQKFQQQVSGAAQKASAMMRISQRIAAGEDPSTVYMQEGPTAGMTADAMSKLSASAGKAAAFIPKTITGNNGDQYTELSPNHWKVTGNVFDQPKTKPTPKDNSVNVNAPEKILYDENGNPSGKAYKTADGRWVHGSLSQDERDALAKEAKNKPKEKEPTQSDIDYLKANPDKAEHFDKEFGEGASDDVLKPPTTQNQDEEDTQPDTQ